MATETSTPQPSAFFHTPLTAAAENLAILHLKRDNLIPVKLQEHADDGYAEGAVTNTRFGSFPHKTLMGLEWGSQVRASIVDTGTRGRNGKAGKNKGPKSVDVQANDISVKEEACLKRTSAEAQLNGAEGPAKKSRREAKATNGDAAGTKVPIQAGSGFIHLLQPTPEAWTYSLDHRTQVVYVPDSSYILQRLRVRPGQTLIEAGAGSGSFTHASARAVFSGYPGTSSNSKNKFGKICSFEYHAPRVETLRQELADHGLDGIVQLTHRDVCNEGFVLDTPDSPSPNADAIFLDLPAPWLALKHLTRSGPNSPLNPESPIQLCTFSPCIEQVIATVSAMRKLGWIDIEMVEIQNRRLDVRREQVGLKYEGLRGVNASAASVEEAIGRLREVESKLNDFHANKNAGSEQKKVESKQERLERIKKESMERQSFKEGNLVNRTEPEVKTHTSYLVFAILPREWTEEDEKLCAEKWSVDEIMKSSKADKKTNGRA
ncbi:Hypothetical protein R9X50_00440700 [Acrodontium crateriforme]|uniref:tRNA (adenine(58)-N(1))-methyltransferase catalytic subunit TRM61 n=1 Tax=Acrodontium crateriforme TaxID=150365 RepID=A0AAQ3RAS8_9PEZI|nr:Hypothetical protein R9X50_00440700 [Acrodontium crateriforme]